ncbi:MFS transporter [Litorivivens sp.]|uniref:MFS transporter n=1 Tax=Litorivivens sp. TaxID=2020868 RepID=UPI00356B1A9F
MKPQGGWYLVVLLFFAYMLSFLDRQIIALLIEPIKLELGISDFQFSLLHGLGFGVFFALFGIPIALAADRWNRTRIIGLGIVVWSAMTVVCGLARSYLQLFLGRIGVGVGEAALAPAAYSLLADVFDRKRLPTAMAVFSMGRTVGSGLAFLLGGYLLTTLAQWDRSEISWLAGYADWQLAFMMAGMPGLLLALFIFALKEPVRKGLLDTRPQSVAAQLRSTFVFLLSHKRLYLGIFIAIAATTAMSSGFIVWAPVYLMREFGFTPPEAAARFGSVFIVAASAGVLGGGLLASHWQPRFGQITYLRVMRVAMSGTLLAILPLPLLTDPVAVLVLIGLAVFFTQSLAAVSVASIQVITPNEKRAQLSSYFLLFVNLLGYGSGAPLVAAVTDFVWRDPSALGWSLSLAALVLLPLALVAVTVAWPHYKIAPNYAIANPESPAQDDLTYAR